MVLHIKTTFGWSLSVVALLILTTASGFTTEQDFGVGLSLEIKPTTEAHFFGTVSTPNSDKCVSSADCRNGAECLKDKDGSNYCKCRNGTRGDTCEVVDDCVRYPMPCGLFKDVECVYDLEKQKAKCKCNNESKQFDSYLEKCRVPCTSSDECPDHILCRRKPGDDYRFCRCYMHSGGDRCEDRDVDQCQDRGLDCGSNPNVTCEDGKDGPVCYCHDWSEGYNYQAKDCLKCDCEGRNLGCQWFPNGTKQCYCEKLYYQEDDKCKDCQCGFGANGCKLENGNKKCDCWSRYSDNDGVCAECYCGENQVDCTFKDKKKSCTCKPEYVEFNGTCRKNCSVWGVECEHGGECVDSVCQCLAGTSGDVCEDIEGCETQWEERKKCGVYIYDDLVTCDFNVTSLKAYCRCKTKGYLFDETNQKCKKNCDSWGVECKNGGKCVNSLCQCLPGTRGDECEVIKECDSLWKQSILCGDYKNEVSCDFNVTSLQAYCRCKNKGYLFDERNRRCKACDCGENGSCRFVGGWKTCDCKKGYSEKPPALSKPSKCEPCDCGKQSTACSFTISGKKSCYCQKGYSQKGVTCEKCDCGDHALCLFNVFYDKECICDFGYAERKGSCYECRCGLMGRCDFDERNQKRCICNEEYGYNGDECQYCGCYLDGYTKINCTFKNKQKTCLCPEGYRANGLYCNDINECLNQSACPLNTICKNTIGNYTCGCKTGYRPFSSQHDTKIYGCTEINECVENTACPYRDTSECVNTLGSYHCRCKSGYSSPYSTYTIEMRGCEDDQTGWKIGYIFLIVVFIISSTALLIAIKKKSSS